MTNICIKNKSILRSVASSIRIIICVFALIGLFNKETTASSIYIWTIDANHTWKALQNYLPKAKMSGTTVYVGLLPPTNSPNYSKPYGLDFISWAKEIAKLSIRYSNLKEYAIKDLQKNLTQGYLRQSYIDSVIAAGKAINSKLIFDPSIYNTVGSSGDITPPPAPINFTAVLTNGSSGTISPLSISPTIDSKWNADWEIQSLKDRVYIVANPHADAVNPSPSVALLKIYKNDNYSQLANGHPRAEFQRSNFFFTYGHTFKYTFKNYFPAGFKFDVSGANNQNILTQIKQTGALGGGSPPRAFGHNGTQYYVDDYISIPGGKTIFHRTLFGDATVDVGKWVKWTVEFKADSLSGAGHGYYKLYKNDALVYSDNDRTWAYTTNPEFYMKVGVYKYDWLNYPSSQDSISLYLDDIQLTDITNNVNSTITNFAATATNATSPYVDLSWTNPTVTDLDSIYIYSSLANDPATATLVAKVSKSSTTYRDIVSTADQRYYWLKAKDTSGNISQFSAVAVTTLVMTSSL